jgi:hypothetical protein
VRPKSRAQPQDSEKKTQEDDLGATDVRNLVDLVGFEPTISSMPFLISDWDRATRK